MGEGVASSLPANSSLLNSQLARGNVLDHSEDLGKVVERGEGHVLLFAVGDEICVCVCVCGVSSQQTLGQWQWQWEWEFVRIAKHTLSSLCKEKIRLLGS